MYLAFNGKVILFNNSCDVINSKYLCYSFKKQRKSKYNCAWAKILQLKAHFLTQFEQRKNNIFPKSLERKDAFALSRAKDLLTEDSSVRSAKYYKRIIKLFGWFETKSSLLIYKILQENTSKNNVLQHSTCHKIILSLFSFAYWFDLFEQSGLHCLVLLCKIRN